MSSARPNQSEKSQKSNLPTHKIRLARIIEHPQTIFCQGINIKDGVTRAQRCCGIKRTHTGFVHGFPIVNTDKTALNTLLDNVYYLAKIQIA